MRLSATRPDRWIIAIAAIAWASVVIGEVVGLAGDGEASSSGVLEKGLWFCAIPVGRAAPDGAAFGGLPSAITHWAVMVAAMMLPLTVGTARWLTSQTRADQRVRAVVSFVIGFMAIWTIAGVAIVLIASHFGLHEGYAAALLLAAAIWHVSNRRKRILRRCGASTLPAVDGWRSIRDCVAMGSRHARRCLGTCGLVMAPMALAHSPVLMVAAFAVGASERRRSANPEDRAGRPIEAVVLVGMSALISIGLLAEVGIAAPGDGGGI